MSILPTNARVRFGSQDTITGTIVGHGVMIGSGGTTISTYAVRLDEKWQGQIPSGCFISTMLGRHE